jgi:hypothetical protein
MGFVEIAALSTTTAQSLATLSCVRRSGRGEHHATDLDRWFEDARPAGSKAPGTPSILSTSGSRSPVSPRIVCVTRCAPCNGLHLLSDEVSVQHVASSQMKPVLQSSPVRREPARVHPSGLRLAAGSCESLCPLWSERVVFSRSLSWHGARWQLDGTGRLETNACTPCSSLVGHGR